MIRQVKISGRTYKVSLVPELTKEGKERMGWFDGKEGTIEVNADFDDLEQADTLLHEIIHAIDFYSGIGLKERQVIALASQLIAVFKTNPSLVKYITESL